MNEFPADGLGFAVGGSWRAPLPSTMPSGQTVASPALAVRLHAGGAHVVAQRAFAVGDFVLEVHVAGSLAKDLTGNVEKYARLGIGEYFVFDKTHGRIHGYRLPAAQRGTVRPARAYAPVIPQMGRWSSEVLGIDLTLENGQLRFMVGNAPLEHAEEVIHRLGSMLDDVIATKEAEERERLEAVARLEAELAEEKRAREEEKRALEKRVAELEADLARRDAK